MSISIAPLRVQNQFDSIDLSDNGVGKLEGFPKLPRLKVLLLSNNRISKIARQLEGGQRRLARPSPAHTLSRCLLCLLQTPFRTSTRWSCRTTRSPNCRSVSQPACAKPFDRANPHGLFPQPQDLDPLTTVSKLKLLSLLENPVTKVPNYR
jgi:Leucine-rich repeat (LRR) protein